jgi:methyl-accepting chemotaxis protein
MLDAVPAAALLIADGVFVECNRYAVRIFNARDRSDIIGKPPSLISPPEQPDGRSSDEAAKNYIMAAMQGTPQTFYYRHITLDKKPLDVEVSLERIDFEGVGYLQVSFRDLKVQKYMEQEIDGLTGVYATMAEGDLTPRYDISRPDRDTQVTYEQLVKLRDAVRGIITNLQQNIRAVNGQMDLLTSTAENATKNIVDASTGLAQTAQNAGQVSANAQKSSVGIDQITKAMQDMSAAVEEITANVENVSSQARQSGELATSGAALSENVVKGMGEIAVSSGNVYDIVQDIQRQMAEISKIVVIIRDLANQTNLLALNAAIEAARAGDHGRGFAVVAAEVKSLAQDSRESAEKIEAMIQNLTTVTTNATHAMEEVKLVVEKGTHMSTDALDSFRQIREAVDRVSRSASDVAAASEEQAATTEEITASVHELATLVDETSKEAGEAAAAIEESTAFIDEVSRMVQAVNQVAAEAKEANRKFRVD